MLEICFLPQVAWHLSQLRPRQKQSSLQFEWWLGLTDAEKEGEFSWELDHDETLWGEVDVEAGSSPPLCGTMDANLTLRGVECTVGETETATRTILCETGGKSPRFLLGIYNQSYDGFNSQAYSVRVTETFNQKAADAWEEIQVENNIRLSPIT